MTIFHDNVGNAYCEIDNLRITLVRIHTHKNAKERVGSDVIRISAFEIETESGDLMLKPGFEFPLGQTLRVIAALAFFGK
ncbi:MAG: hypothetical protein DRQ54_11435 [Gammaproteobacteria bacterium]|nr:MAG: hypothetical protein DRQ54_11435 [Gammaproteobacteria bacterium]